VEIVSNWKRILLDVQTLSGGEHILCTYRILALRSSSKVSWRKVFFLQNYMVHQWGAAGGSIWKIVVRHWMRNLGPKFYMCTCAPILHVHKICSLQGEGTRRRMESTTTWTLWWNEPEISQGETLNENDRTHLHRKFAITSNLKSKPRIEESLEHRSPGHSTISITTRSN
jgi:hypothetical protein